MYKEILEDLCEVTRNSTYIKTLVNIQYFNLKYEDICEDSNVFYIVISVHGTNVLEITQKYPKEYKQEQMEEDINKRAVEEMFKYGLNKAYIQIKDN